MRGFAWSSATLAIGYAIAAALFWALLNVPESNVFALALSAALAVSIAGAAAITTGLAVAIGCAHPAAPVGRQALRAVPRFFAGLVVFVMLWWLTGWIDGWWQAHRGQVDAVILHRLGATRTEWLHLAVSLAVWFVRWVLGLSVIAGLVVAGTLFVRPAYCLRLSFRPTSLIVAAAGIAAVSEGLWRLAYWRPTNLPATSAELVFVAAKLATLYGLAIAIAAVVLNIYARSVLKSIPPTRISLTNLTPPLS